MEFKTGDKVRVVELEYMDTAFKIDEVITIKRFSKNLMNKEIIFFENKSYALYPSQVELVEETSNYITTKEFIKLVEDMGYKIYSGIEEISIENDSPHGLASVHKTKINTLGITRTLDMPNNLFNVLTLYANTPLELREEKEQLYTLELPNTNSYYRYYVRDNYEYLFDDIHDDNGYQHKFTQKEIDNLPNQELIRTLKQEPVK